MRVTLLYFAAARERAGTPAETLDLPDGATAGDAKAAAIAAHPGLAAIAAHLRIAVDRSFAADDARLPPGSEVAFIPPVSGGTGGHRIGPEPLSVDAALQAVRGPDCGAVVHFTGVVRGKARGKDVVALEYEAYARMALEQFGRIEAEARGRWPGARVVIHHRTGRLAPGELSVVIAAAAPHRADAFAACSHAIEALKADAAIWKRELYPDGSAWVGPGS